MHELDGEVFLVEIAKDRDENGGSERRREGERLYLLTPSTGLSLSLFLSLCLSLFLFLSVRGPRRNDARFDAEEKERRS